MRRIPLCLFVPFVLACGTGPSEPNIRLEGTVTAADDGSPITAAWIDVFEAKRAPIHHWTRIPETTDLLGRYAISFLTEGRGCRDDEFWISINAVRKGFGLLILRGGQFWYPLYGRGSNPGLSASTPRGLGQFTAFTRPQTR